MFTDTATPAAVNSRIVRSRPAGEVARLQLTSEVGVQRYKRERHPARVHLRQARPEIDIAQHERALGHRRHRLSAACHYLKAPPGDPHLVLDRLVNISNCRHHDRLRPPALGCQFPPEQFRRIRLGHQLRLEVQPATEAEVFVVGACKAINAPMLAAAIWIQRPIKGNVRSRCDAIDDSLRTIEKDVALHAMERSVFILAFDPLPVQFFAEDVKSDGFESIAWVDPGSAPMGWAVGKRVTKREIDFSLFHPNIVLTQFGGRKAAFKNCLL